MTDHDEKLSALMDGELAHSEQTVDAILRDEQMALRWQRYHVMRDALHGQLPAHPVSVAERVSLALQDEATILAPRKWHKRIFTPQLMKQVAGMAVAASVATVAVLSVQQGQISQQVPGSNTAPVASVQPSARDIRTVADSRTQRLRPAVESRLSGYLVNHNEYSASGRFKGVMPYTRIVSVVPGESVVKAKH